MWELLAKLGELTRNDPSISYFGEDKSTEVETF